MIDIAYNPKKINMVTAIASRFRQFTVGWKRQIAYIYRGYGKRHIWLGLLSGIIALLLVLSVVNPGLAQKPPEPSTNSFVVATRVIPPFVFADKGELSGFSIDLWRSIATKLGIDSKFVEYSTVPDLLSAVKDSKANVGIAAISITAERQESFDFSLPMFAAGLQIMVRPPLCDSFAGIWYCFAAGCSRSSCHLVI